MGLGVGLGGGVGVGVGVGVGAAGVGLAVGVAFGCVEAEELVKSCGRTLAQPPRVTLIATSTTAWLSAERFKRIIDLGRRGNRPSFKLGEHLLWMNTAQN